MLLLALVAPFVFLANLLFLLGSKVILDVEGDTDLLGRFSLKHISDRLARQIEQILDFQEVGSLVDTTKNKVSQKVGRWLRLEARRRDKMNWTHQNQLKEGGLVQARAELLVPWDDIICASLILLVVARRGRVLEMILAILLNLLHDLEAYVLDRDSTSLRISQICIEYRANQSSKRG